MTDLLAHLRVEVGCRTCDSTYEVPLDIVRDSQRVLAAGCSGASTYECDASFYAGLVEPAAIDNLARAWAAFVDSAESHGGLTVTFGGDDMDQDRRALERWENEGGRGISRPRS
jgi:hypothetical protein